MKISLSQPDITDLERKEIINRSPFLGFYEKRIESGTWEITIGVGICIMF